LGPTTAEMPGGNSMEIFSKKDLKPVISNFFNFIKGILLLFAFACPAVSIPLCS
jgi:hypothetical protein